ncbi:MAG TPA: helix-turn-helix transcriptional regulator [Bacteroidia bacterium]|nr:helix-turn-helix transcriptional regulator [Bacteroidia bacterium]
MNQDHQEEITRRMVEAAKHVISVNKKITDMKAFAETIGSGPVQASRWISGKGSVTLNDVVNASTIFGISLEWLCLGIGEMYLSRLQQMENRIAVLEKSVKKSVRINKNSAVRIKTA